MLAAKRILQYVKKGTSNIGIIYPKNAEVCLLYSDWCGHERDESKGIATVNLLSQQLNWLSVQLLMGEPNTLT
uniref:Uncharacterized protein n=1 Tax=Medicago truncatula TaxID=3880 RepID=A2Q292_MEDTR|nr:hypothetical protein MtrDRAFT_AC149576g16v2 [Medicago truncatula]